MTYSDPICAPSFFSWDADDAALDDDVTPFCSNGVMVERRCLEGKKGKVLCYSYTLRSIFPTYC